VKKYLQNVQDGKICPGFRGRLQLVVKILMQDDLDFENVLVFLLQTLHQKQSLPILLPRVPAAHPETCRLVEKYRETTLSRPTSGTESDQQCLLDFTTRLFCFLDPELDRGLRRTSESKIIERFLQIRTDQMILEVLIQDCLEPKCEERRQDPRKEHLKTIRTVWSVRNSMLVYPGEKLLFPSEIKDLLPTDLSDS